MKINGKDILGADIIALTHPTDTTARIAFDHDKGALLIEYIVPDSMDEAALMGCDPQIIDYDEKGTGAVYFKQTQRKNPETGQNEYYRPWIKCRVSKVPYNDKEKTLFDKRESNRQKQQRRIEAEQQANKDRQEQAKQNRNFQDAIIAIAKNKRPPSPTVNTSEVKPKKPPYSYRTLKYVADLFHQNRVRLEKSPKHRDFFANYQNELTNRNITNLADLKRCLDTARRHKDKLLPRWKAKKRKSSGKC